MLQLFLKRELRDVYSKAAHFHDLYCIGHIITNIYMNKCVCVYIYIHAHAKNILRWQWSLITEQFTGWIYFLHFAWKRISIFYSRYYIHCTLWNLKGIEIDFSNILVMKQIMVSKYLCYLHDLFAVVTTNHKTWLDGVIRKWSNTMHGFESFLIPYPRNSLQISRFKKLSLCSDFKRYLFMTISITLTSTC